MPTNLRHLNSNACICTVKDDTEHLRSIHIIKKYT